MGNAKIRLCSSVTKKAMNSSHGNNPFAKKKEKVANNRHPPLNQGEPHSLGCPF
uniref:Uncharacterized protein n=1 Tax=Rhizophora mucronata TaxID=61149 RepID=A0A2P2N7I0_RHIMU